MRILSVKILRSVDTDPDLSWLGEYSNRPGPNAIERPNCGRNEYRYFNPAMSGEETGNPNSPAQDFARMEAYNAGDWCSLYLRAEACVQLTPQGPVQRISSGGLCGVESDAGTYLDEAEGEQLDELRNQLTALGIPSETIDEAFAANVERVDV